MGSKSTTTKTAKKAPAAKPKPKAEPAKKQTPQKSEKVQKDEKIHTTAAEDKEAAWVAGVIKDGANAVTHLKVGPITISPKSLTDVADGILRSEVGVAYLDDPEKDPFTAKTLVIVLRTKPKGELTWYKATIVHEAVHAAIDLQGSKKSFSLNSIDGEIAAFMVEAMYLKKQGVKADSAKVKSDEFMLAAYAAVEEYKKNNKGGPKMEKLREVVSGRYKSEILKANGQAK